MSIKLTINLENIPVIDIKSYLDTVAARVKFFVTLNEYMYQEDSQYRERKLNEAKFLGLTEKDILEFIEKNNFNESDDDIPF